MSDAWSKVAANRRSFLQKLVGTAFVVPLISSFPMGGASEAKAQALRTGGTTAVSTAKTGVASKTGKASDDSAGRGAAFTNKNKSTDEAGKGATSRRGQPSDASAGKGAGFTNKNKSTDEAGKAVGMKHPGAPTTRTP